jgi:hypothetical protein
VMGKPKNALVSLGIRSLPVHSVGSLLFPEGAGNIQLASCILNVLEGPPWHVRPRHPHTLQDLPWALGGPVLLGCHSSQGDPVKAHTGLSLSLTQPWILVYVVEGRIRGFQGQGCPDHPFLSLLGTNRSELRPWLLYGDVSGPLSSAEVLVTGILS